jgi:N-acetylmuramoyl-L-alanine amidase
MRLVERPSPNHDARPDGARVDMLVLHYTGMKTAEEALARLCDPAAKVSAHYTIDEAGTVWRHVAEERRAWHAGASFWAGEASVNNRSVGIELVNPGHEFGYVPYTDRQIAALIDLADAVVKRHRIPSRRVLGHSDVAPGRKTDPGELFPWQHLADFGIGVWPRTPVNSPLEGGSKSAQQISGRGDIPALLSRFGYGVPPQVDAPLESVIAAFQRHFRPTCIDGVADAECAAILASLPPA